MALLASSSSTRALEPIDRVSEILFGLIMVLTFTGSLSVAEAGRDDVRAMLVGALGCNLAWGIIDAVLYLMGCAAERGQQLAAFRALRAEPDARKGQRLLADALPPMVAGVMESSELEALRQRLLNVPEPAGHRGLTWEDSRGALAVFLLVFVSTLPVAIPFMVMPEAQPALRVSNLIAVALLFMTGYAFGRISGRPPLVVGGGMVVLGGALVALTMALGG